MNTWKIKCVDAVDDDGDPLYWSNEIGWTGKGDADRFSQKERDEFNLPIGGEWEAVVESFPPLDLIHASEIVEDAASYLVDEHVTPCDESKAIAEGLATLAMHLRYPPPIIAAAPELLDLLRAAAKRVEIANNEGNPILSAWLVDAKAAIEKATGVQS